MGSCFRELPGVLLALANKDGRRDSWGEATKSRVCVMAVQNFDDNLQVCD